jgi:hypothetical protein
MRTRVVTEVPVAFEAGASKLSGTRVRGRVRYVPRRSFEPST